MLLKLNNLFSKKFLINFIYNKNFFFVFDVKNVDELTFIYEYFSDNVLHLKQIVNFYGNNVSLSLFSGNSYFCFIDSSQFFSILVDLYHNKLVHFNLNLVGICYNNYFLNFNMNYFNVLSSFFLNTFIVFFICLLFVNLFFFKIVFLLKKIFVLKIC